MGDDGGQVHGKFDVGDGGQFLHQEIVVKDEILGDEGGLVCGGGVAEKLGLKKMGASYEPSSCALYFERERWVPRIREER